MTRSIEFAAVDPASVTPQAWPRSASSQKFRWVLAGEAQVARSLPTTNAKAKMVGFKRCRTKRSWVRPGTRPTSPSSLKSFSSASSNRKRRSARESACRGLPAMFPKASRALGAISGSMVHLHVSGSVRPKAS